jgi:hypothetical protein
VAESPVHGFVQIMNVGNDSNHDSNQIRIMIRRILPPNQIRIMIRRILPPNQIREVIRRTLIRHEKPTNIKVPLQYNNLANITNTNGPTDISTIARQIASVERSGPEILDGNEWYTKMSWV